MTLLLTPTGVVKVGCHCHQPRLPRNYFLSFHVTKETQERLISSAETCYGTIIRQILGKGIELSQPALDPSGPWVLHSLSPNPLL